MISSTYNTCTVSDGVGPYRNKTWISKAWVNSSCTLTAEIDKTLSPGWYFPEYTSPTSKTVGYDFRREFRGLGSTAADACLTWWDNDNTHLKGTCLAFDGGKCVKSQVTVPCAGTGNICDPAIGYFTAWIPVNVQNLPFLKELIIKNSDGVVVPPEAGGNNQICQDAFRKTTNNPRDIKFEAVVGDSEGYINVSSVVLKYGANSYNMTYKSGSGVGTSAIYETTVNFPISTTSTPIDLTPLSVLVTNRDGATNNSLPATGRSLEIWDCKLDISGKLYDGSSAPFGQPVCASGVGFSNPYGGSAYGLSYNRTIPVGALYQAAYGSGDKVMSVTTPDYNQGVNQLIWGDEYNPIFSNVDGSVPTMCVNTTQPVTLRTADFVDPYNPSAIKADFSTVMYQDAWYQLVGGNLRASTTVSNRIPITCANNPSQCRAAMCVNQEGAGLASMSNGIVMAPSITNDSSCSLLTSCRYGTPDNWYWTGNPLDGNTWALSNNTYGYDYWYQKLVTENKIATVINSGATWSVVSGSIGSTGIVLVNGNLEIDSNNDVPSGKSLMVIAKGGVRVKQEVTDWEGILISDGDIMIDGVNDNQLQMRGIIYSDQRDIIIKRTYNTDPLNGGQPDANNLSPAVRFVYEPNLIFNIPPIVFRIISGFTAN
jgi:hypothetical protein